MLKKIIYIVLIGLMIIPYIIFPQTIHGINDNRTIQDLKNELDALEKKYEDVENNKELTQQQIATIKQNIVNIGTQLTAIEDETIQIGIDIENLNDEISLKDEEIKKLINFLHVTTGESMYLEYAFGADSITDFIYRVSVVEQMTNYNNKLIDEMNTTIDEKNQKVKNLSDKKIELNNKKKSLSEEQSKLGNRIYALDEDARTIQEDILDAKKVIQNYLNLGCKLTDKISNCAAIPQDASFARPLNSGVITQLYGWRVHPVTGRSDYHGAIDIGGNATGTYIYSIAAGRVIRVYNVSTPHIANSSCGGNYVVIQHQVNGVSYTSRYMHLNRILVSENDKVTKDTVIATVGGGESYDWCTTGPHLHMNVAKGVYAQDFYSFTEPYTFNPASIIYLPNRIGARWNGRYQKIS